MLSSIEGQTRRPDQVIIVDGGSVSVEGIVSGCSALHIDYLQCHPPSASRQRNSGIRWVRPEMDFVGFFDDDIVLDPRALEMMLRFWEHAPKDVAGAAFNMINHPPLSIAFLKRSSLAERIGVYGRKRGSVLPSGFHTMIGVVNEDIFVDWIPTGACLWKKSLLESKGFDEWFSGYSYLEDLEFSYRIRKNHRLVVIAEARYEHFPAPSGRIRNLLFGRREVRNRLYFVKKNPELSMGRCYLALVLRMLMSLQLSVSELKSGYLARALGNMVELANPFKNIRKAHIEENVKNPQI